MFIVQSQKVVFLNSKIMKRFTVFIYALIIFCGSPGIVTSQTLTAPHRQQAQLQYRTPFNKVPDRRDVTMYQVNIRAFSEHGNLNGVIARLDSIKALGVNVIYLMPIYPVGVLKTTNSPYCIRDYRAVNHEFGTLNDLRNLVDGAHRRNMAVVLDWVANHTSYDHVWIKHKSWYLQDSTGNIISPPGTGWNDVAQLNFKNFAMRREMIKDMKYWVYAANVDGFRCDFADGPPIDFWRQAIDTLRNISTHKLLMLAEGTRSANFDAGFDYNFGFSFYGNLKSIYSANKSVLSIDTLNQRDYIGASNGQQVVRYITNHDVNSSDGTPLQLFDGKKGSMAAFVVVACMKSVPMIYNGQEIGMATPITFPFTTVKIDWTSDPDVTAEYKKIIAFRNSNTAVRRGHLTSYSSADICAFTKVQSGDTVLVISNLRNRSINYSLLSNIANTSWHDGMNGKKVTLKGQLNLNPYQYFILKK